VAEGKGAVMSVGDTVKTYKYDHSIRAEVVEVEPRFGKANWGYRVIAPNDWGYDLGDFCCEDRKAVEKLARDCGQRCARAITESIRERENISRAQAVDAAQYLFALRLDVADACRRAFGHRDDWTGEGRAINCIITDLAWLLKKDPGAKKADAAGLIGEIFGSDQFAAFDEHGRECVTRYLQLVEEELKLPPPAPAAAYKAACEHRRTEREPEPAAAAQPKAMS